MGESGGGGGGCRKRGKGKKVWEKRITFLKEWERDGEEEMKWCRINKMGEGTQYRDKWIPVSG